MIKKCIGCGAVLQNTNDNQIGYVPNLNTKTKYCRRCFRIIHYNELEVIKVLKDEEFVLNEISNNAELVFFIIDFLNINQEVIAKFKRLACKKILIINKVDLIPSSIRLDKIKDWLKEEYKVDESVIFLSATKNKNIGSVIKEIEKNNLKKVYLVGYTNSGKSSILNKLCQKYEVTDKVITTSPVPNTTLDLINIKVNNNLTIIDTPGFIYEETFYLDNEIELIKKLNPQKYIKPITYQLKPKASVIIENKVRIENRSTKKISFTMYMSNDLNIRVVYESNKILNNFPYRIMKIAPNNDLVIKNVGFINIKDECQLGIYTEDFAVYESRKSFF